MASSGSSDWLAGRDTSAISLWAGEYCYDARRRLVGIPGPSKFTLEIHSAALGFFSGTVQDEALAGISAPGKIYGWRGFGRIHFVKRMPVRHKRVVDPKSRQVGEQVADQRRRQPLIFYRGAWVAESNEYRGRWRFLHPFRVPGTWFARRIG